MTLTVKEKELRLLPNEILGEMNQILDYLWDDERNDYLARDEHDRKGHVFAAVQSVRRWIDSTD